MFCRFLRRPQSLAGRLCEALLPAVVHSIPVKVPAFREDKEGGIDRGSWGKERRECQLPVAGCRHEPLSMNYEPFME